MDTSVQEPISPPKPPESISDKKLRTYKLLLIVAILGLLLCVSLLSFLVKKTKKQNNSIGKETTISPTHPKTPRISQSPLPAYTLKSDTCNKKECLFNSPEGNGVLEGFALLDGYYQQYQSTLMGYSSNCDGFVVTGGSEALIESFKKQIARGNGFNKIDKDNNLVVTVPLSQLTMAQKSLLLSSNKNSQVELALIRRTPEGRGSQVCEGNVDIISATPLSAN